MIERFNDQDGNFHGWGHYCPGCEMHHIFDKRWKFDGNEKSPTFTPSMKVTYSWGKERKQCVCHYYLKAGRIQYLSDCTYKLKGKTIELKNINDYD